MTSTIKKPQDRKPKSPKKGKKKGAEQYRRTVEIDGVSVVLDLEVTLDFRLQRRLHKEDGEALHEWMERLFPDLDTVETQFELRTIDDYAAFAQRALEAVPNS